MLDQRLFRSASLRQRQAAHPIQGRARRLQQTQGARFFNRAEYRGVQRLVQIVEQLKIASAQRVGLLGNICIENSQSRRVRGSTEPSHGFYLERSSDK